MLKTPVLTLALLGGMAVLAPRAEAADVVRAIRIRQNPIVAPAMSTTLGDSVNGPSLVRVPDWIEHPLGRYYLYFAHHRGSYIRLAYADQLRGPWHVHDPGTLRLEQAARCYDHIASPDVHVDAAHHEILMYFHCPAGAAGSVDIGEQKTFIATSKDGVKFAANSQALGPAYFRVFQYGQYFYAIVRGGKILRSRNPRAVFEEGATLVKVDAGRILRHAAVDVSGNVLRIYYSRIGDRPERILVTEVRLTPEWSEWSASDPTTILEPERDYEGGTLPLEVSEPDDAPGRVRQLRDPAVYRERSRTYLVYSIGGESGLAMAELVRQKSHAKGKADRR
jgi:hypothetical protein